MAQITHQLDEDTGHYRQIVPPATLRRLLRRDGESLKRPEHFGPDDEWDVGKGRSARSQAAKGGGDDVDNPGF